MICTDVRAYVPMYGCTMYGCTMHERAMYGRTEAVNLYSNGTQCYFAHWFAVGWWQSTSHQKNSHLHYHEVACLLLQSHLPELLKIWIIPASWLRFYSSRLSILDYSIHSILRKDFNLMIKFVVEQERFEYKVISLPYSIPYTANFGHWLNDQWCVCVGGGGGEWLNGVEGGRASRRRYHAFPSPTNTRPTHELLANVPNRLWYCAWNRQQNVDVQQCKCSVCVCTHAPPPPAQLVGALDGGERSEAMW